MKHLLVERGERVEFLTDKSAHGNVRYLEELRQPLRVHVLLRHWVPHYHPLHSPPRRRSIRPRIRSVPEMPRGVSLELLLVVVVLGRRCRGSVASDRGDRAQPPRLRRQSRAAEGGHAEDERERGRGFSARAAEREREEREGLRFKGEELCWK